MATPVRLQRYLAAAGVAARRKAEELITEGRVTVNGAVVRVLGSKVDPDKDSVQVDGEAVYPLEHFYVIFNKPKACITAVTDDRGRPTVMDYLPNVPVPVKPVGRLDFYTEGVLLLTNDGELAAKLLAPGSHVPKTYHVKVHGQLDHDHIKALRNGIELDDGTVTMPADVEVLPGESKHTWLAITIHEGKHRQIHRMIESLGYYVDKLQRVAFANLTFHHLRVGDARELTQQELNELRDTVGLDHSAVARGRWRASREATDIPRRARAKARVEAEDAEAVRLADAEARARGGGVGVGDDVDELDEQDRHTAREYDDEDPSDDTWGWQGSAPKGDNDKDEDWPLDADEAEERTPPAVGRGRNARGSATNDRGGREATRGGRNPRGSASSSALSSASGERAGRGAGAPDVGRRGARGGASASGSGRGANAGDDRGGARGGARAGGFGRGAGAGAGEDRGGARGGARAGGFGRGAGAGAGEDRGGARGGARAGGFGRGAGAGDDRGGARGGARGGVRAGGFGRGAGAGDDRGGPRGARTSVGGRGAARGAGGRDGRGGPRSGGFAGRDAARGGAGRDDRGGPRSGGFAARENRSAGRDEGARGPGVRGGRDERGPSRGPARIERASGFGRRDDRAGARGPGTREERGGAGGGGGVGGRGRSFGASNDRGAAPRGARTDRRPTARDPRGGDEGGGAREQRGGASADVKRGGQGRTFGKRAPAGNRGRGPRR